MQGIERKYKYNQKGFELFDQNAQLYFPVLQTNCVACSERDALSGVQAGVHGGRCDGKRLCEGLR